ncbi:MAG: hypothetical protein ACE366_25105 [Bradymonadia bacterium]
MHSSLVQSFKANRFKSTRPLLSAALFTAVALVSAGCGGAAGGGGGGQGVQSSNTIPEDKLPPAPSGSLWGDGFGDTQQRAVLDARRAVSEQITAKVTATVEAQTSEDATGIDQKIDQKIKSQTDFEHAELIKVIGFRREEGGWTARAALDRREAADVYEKELQADLERLKKLSPVVSESLKTFDTSILLSSEQSPGVLMAEMSRKARILAILGGRGDASGGQQVKSVERKASAARRRAVLRLSVTGSASEGLKRAAVQHVARMFKQRGCTLSEGLSGAPKAKVPTADVKLKVVSRDHKEGDVKYRYVGLEVVAADARSKRNIFRFSAMPDFAHGGGATWAQADKSAARKMGKKLKGAGGKAFEGITCR